MTARIIGGASGRGKISLQSDLFRARAVADANGAVTCTVTPLPKLTRYLNAHPRLPIPILVRLALFGFALMTRRAWLFAIAVVVGIAIGSHFNHPPASSGGNPGRLRLFDAVVTIGVLAYTSRYVARWHGAEHMAIAAYDRDGSTDLASIARQSRIHPKCGGRLSLPATLASIAVVTLVPSALAWLAVAVAWEALLQVDQLWGLEKIPGFVQVFVWTQKYVTTKVPNDIELRTAQRVLEDLTAAHEKLEAARA